MLFDVAQGETMITNIRNQNTPHIAVYHEGQTQVDFDHNSGEEEMDTNKC